MSNSPILTQGLGSFGTVHLIPTLGFRAAGVEPAIRPGSTAAVRIAGGAVAHRRFGAGSTHAARTLGGAARGYRIGGGSSSPGRTGGGSSSPSR